MCQIKFLLMPGGCLGGKKTGESGMENAKLRRCICTWNIHLLSKNITFFFEGTVVIVRLFVTRYDRYCIKILECIHLTIFSRRSQ